MNDWLTRPRLTDQKKKQNSAKQTQPPKSCSQTFKQLWHIPFNQSIARDKIENFGRGLCYGYSSLFMLHTNECGLNYENLRASLNLVGSDTMKILHRELQPPYDDSIKKFVFLDIRSTTVVTGLEFLGSDLMFYSDKGYFIQNINFSSDDNNIDLYTQGPYTIIKHLLFVNSSRITGHAMVSILIPKRQEVHFFDPNGGVFCFYLNEFSKRNINKLWTKMAWRFIKKSGRLRDFDFFKWVNVFYKKSQNLEDTFNRIDQLSETYKHHYPKKQFNKCKDFMNYHKNLILKNRTWFPKTLSFLHNTYNPPKAPYQNLTEYVNSKL